MPNPGRRRIDLAPSLGYTVANTVQPLAGALLLTSVRPRVDLARTTDLTAFIICAVIAGPALGAAVGATTAAGLDDGDAWARFAGEWSVGDGLGVLVVGGAILSLAPGARTSDRGRRLLWVTDAEDECVFLGRGRQEFTGQGGSEGFGLAWTDAIHPDDREAAGEAFLAASAARRAFALDYRLRRVDGAYRWVIDSGRPRLGPDGAFLGYVGSVIDAHERKQVEDALTESETRLRTLCSSIDEGYCLGEMIHDADGRAIDNRFLETNRLFESMTGLEDAVGRTALEMIPDLEPRWIETYARVASGGEPLRFESGSEAMGRWFDVVATPAGASGAWFALVFKDVTERRRADIAWRSRHAPGSCAPCRRPSGSGSTRERCRARRSPACCSPSARPARTRSSTPTPGGNPVPSCSRWPRLRPAPAGARMTDPLARLDAAREGEGRVVLTVAGEIDNSNATSLEARMADEAGTAGHVVVDLAAVTYIDSQGLRLLVELSRRLSATGTALTIVAPPASFAAEVLEITSMGALLYVVEAIEGAGPGG